MNGIQFKQLKYAKFQLQTDVFKCNILYC